MIRPNGSVFGGALLVAGTTIGGGMLALPVLTSQGGFFPSLLIYFSCWLFMTLTGLLFLELALQMKEGVNIVSMAEKTLGRPGKFAAWVLYLFLFYCLTVAYLVGCGDILSNSFEGILPRRFGPLVFCLIFAPFVYAGTRTIDTFNKILMGVLGILFILFVILGLPQIKWDNLMYSHPRLSLLALPIAFTSFAYQGIIPTLVTYLDRKADKIKASIWIGTTLPFLIYTVWQILILGIVPFDGPHGLQNTLALGQNAVYPLKYFLDNPYIYSIGECFAFLALLTSFFGVTLGLMDFLADGLNIKKTHSGKGILSVLIFTPPLLIALIYPSIFLQALDYAGGYGCSLLLGLLPILMVARLRKTTFYLEHQIGGGNIILGIMALFVIFELIIEIST